MPYNTVQSELERNRNVDQYDHTALALGAPESRHFNTFRVPPPEIIHCIAECLLALGRTGDLAVFCLLRRDLAAAIQAILFGHVALSNFQRCHRLTLTLRFGGAALSSLVRHITATLDTEPRIQGRLFLARDVTELYALCPMLSHITLVGGRSDGPGEQLFPDIRDALRLGTLSTVESLTLTGPPSNFGPWLLFHLPNLRALYLFGDTTISPFSTPPSSGRNLRHITWGLASPSTSALIRWLFADSREVIDGSLTLITPPISPLEMENIYEYCSSRGIRMVCRTLVAPEPL